MSEAPLMYLFLMGAVSAGAPIVLLLKVLSPLLLVLLGLTVYFYANKALSWQPKKPDCSGVCNLVFCCVADFVGYASNGNWSGFPLC
jgi:hypothetical protein